MTAPGSMSTVRRVGFPHEQLEPASILIQLDDAGLRGGIRLSNHELRTRPRVRRLNLPITRQFRVRSLACLTIATTREGYDRST